MTTFDEESHLKIAEKWSFLNRDITKIYEQNYHFFGVHMIFLCSNLIETSLKKFQKLIFYGLN